LRKHSERSAYIEITTDKTQRNNWFVSCSTIVPSSCSTSIQVELELGVDVNVIGGATCSSSSSSVVVAVVEEAIEEVVVVVVVVVSAGISFFLTVK
jgi:hypothetical protein